MRKFLALLCLVPMLAFAQSYTTFPNLQSGNVNFTATIRANGGACSSGQAVVSGGGSVSCVTLIPSSEKGANSGVATLDSGGKVPTSQLPFSGLTYDGSWNANTNSPTLADGVGTSGHFYITSVAGTQNLGSGSQTFAVGDWALYNGTIWQKVPSSTAVASVFGRTGAVTATAGDYTATQVTNTPAGGISATTAQAAINELDTEKQVAAASLTSWAALTRASGFDTFTQTPSSANLRGLLTDEVGTGAAYFVGGALGTPASVTLSNGTGLPWSTGLTGVPTTAVGYGITGGAKLDAYAGGDTPSAFTLGIVDSVDAATWRSAIGAGTATITPAALTKADDTNVTLTLGGTPSTSLLQAASITAGWTGTLAVARGGTGVGTLTGLALGNGTSAFSAYTGTSCTNQFPRSLSALGAATCASVSLSADVTGTLADGSLSSNVPLKNAANTFTANQTLSKSDAILFTTDGTRSLFVAVDSSSGKLGTNSNHPVGFYANDILRGTIAAAGSWSLPLATSGTTLSVASSSTQRGMSVTAAAGQIPQLTFIQTGQTEASIYQPASSNALGFDVNGGTRLTLLSGAILGAPTGGDKGAGTLNTAGGIYQNNVSVCLSDGTNCPSSGSGVSSLTGTSNQVIASASTGAVTLSLPQSIATGSSVQFGSFGVGTAASGVTGEIRATDDITAFYSSDARLKENVVVIPDALEKVGKLRGVTFDWKPQYMESRGGEDGYFIRKHDVGVIAQEVRAVLPEVVGEREDGILAVKYDRLTALLIEAVKDLKAANDELYERVKVLEARR